jgi:hypothetical protein
MRVTRRSLRPALLFALGLIACRPDVPGRDCKTNADCFTQEVCTDGTCADAPVSVGAGGAGGTPMGGTPVGGTPVGGAPAGGTPAPDALVSAPDGLPADAATTDAGAPDAAP